MDLHDTKKKAKGKKRLRMKAKKRSFLSGGKLTLDLGKKFVLTKGYIFF